MAEKIKYSFFITDNSEFFQKCIIKDLNASQVLKAIMKIQHKEMTKKFDMFNLPTQYQIGIYVPSDFVHDVNGEGFCEIRTKFDNKRNFLDTLYFDDTLLEQTLEYKDSLSKKRDYLDALKEIVSVAEKEGYKLEKTSILEKAINL